MNKLIVENLLEPIKYDYVQKTLDLFDKISVGEEDYPDASLEERKDAIIEKVMKEKDLINEITQHVRQTRMYKQSSHAKERRENNFMSFIYEASTKEERAFKAYAHLLIKIADAPTQLHARGAIIFIMPILNELIS